MRIELKSVLVITGILFVGLIGGLAYRARLSDASSATANERHAAPILIPGITEPEEMRVEPISFVVPTPRERMLGEALEQSRNKGDAAALLPAIDRVIARYPDYADAYVGRLGLLCDGKDGTAILADINSALKYIGSSRMAKDLPDTAGSLLSIRAKIERANGDDSSAMEDLDKAIHANLADATKFVNGKATAPQKTASPCTWTMPDMDALVRHFPNDYRTHLFRGLYYGSFAALNQDSVTPALENLRKAREINRNSALPHFFSAHILNKGYTFKRGGMSEALRGDLNRTLLNELTAALTLDPNLLPALKDRAEVYFELKQFQQAIPDYDQVLILNPTDAGAYNDRALAKIQLGDKFGALSDFDKAIENTKRELMKSDSYEGRAEAYMKTRQWDLAIRDLTTAISLQIGGIAMVGNIKQFRAFYPEYKTASDEAVARKLNQTFYPNMKYEDFSKGLLHTNKAWASTVVPDLYMKRSDAYLKAGNWHSAAVEYRRAVDGFPRYADAIDRWREISSKQDDSHAYDSHVYVDVKTFDDARSDSRKVWVKQTRAFPNDVAIPYSIEQYELNCGTKQIRRLSFAEYGSSGNLIGTSESDKWGSIVPETLGETLFSGLCRNN